MKLMYTVFMLSLCLFLPTAFATEGHDRIVIDNQLEVDLNVSVTAGPVFLSVPAHTSNLALYSLLRDQCERYPTSTGSQYCYVELRAPQQGDYLVGYFYFWATEPELLFVITGRGADPTDPEHRKLYKVTYRDTPLPLRIEVAHDNR